MDGIASGDPPKGVTRLTDRLFSVMKKRDDLPEMTLPLALLFLFGSAVFASAAAKLASPAAESAILDPSNLLGITASLPFLPAAACLYALLILLWRRMLSLLTTPVMFAMMLLMGADVFPSAVITLSLLFTSYVFAVSLIGRENRFRRLACLAMSAALCITLACIAWLGLEYDSFADFVEAYMNDIPRLMSDAVSSYLGIAAGESISADPSLFLSSAREILVMLPAFIGVISILLAWFVDFLASTAFKVLDCEDVFIEITNRITLPFSYAVIYASVFLMFILTSSDSAPMLTVMLRSVLYVMLPPCAAVGIHGLMLILEDKLYYMTREKFLAALILFLSLTFLGFSAFLLIASAAGAAFVITAKIRSSKNSGSTSK